MELLLDFGNTRVKAAVTDGGILRQVFSGESTVDALSAAVSGMDIRGGMWCSVHELDQSVTEWMKGIGLKQLTASVPVPLKISYRSVETLGMDRLAAAVGAWSMKPGNNMLVIDAGTAVTCDFISAEGVYEGGNIAPGIGLRFRSLHEHTGRLPLVRTDGDVPMFGYDTETAIRSGVVNGIRYEIEGYIHNLESLYPSVLIFLTGGDAECFDIKAKSLTFAVPDLVLRGLARIVEYNEKGF